MPNRVFLCYSSRDEFEAARIHRELAERGLEVWWDGNLPSKSNWAEEVARGLAESNAMLVLVSPDSMESDLVKKELEQALANEGYRNRIFPAFIEPTYAVPWYFRGMRAFDLTGDRSKALVGVVTAITAA
jgi:hypothetical protein